ncbi:hypothetical protein HMPREF1544_03589 [Mucor circinelloides 1006PhL]|uniref:PH domain-containing protein n=1 Tax=Mucor circinelloides f. circinelloides (strain 1006PhL) TaxID=1220926 RepID=S2JGT6_MUCC1|nr:hypothetical protein HMPREF1544_03589 [Mucor circinelloides 1006PhL]
MNVNQVKSELTAQLNDKEKILGRAGTSQISRNALIKQTDVIRKELLDLNRFEQEDELPDDLRLKLEGLANEVQFLKSSKSTGLQDNSMNASPLLLPPAPTNSSPSKQRTKVANGNRRNPDIEFATEIGQGLLIEVRKLQVNIQEKDETIKQLELALADKERNQETSERHLKQREEVEERLKEENWNLEVANQELRAHLSESNQIVTKHNSEFSRVTKQLKTQSEQIDIMKAQEEKNASVMEAMKARHEQETYHLRRHAASAQRDNSQLQKQVEALNTELKICKAKLSIKLASTSRTAEDLNTIEPNAEPIQDQDSESDQINNATSTATVSPQSRNQAMETETLKQSLAHAHRIISNLRSSYHKEKLEKFELKKMLSDSQETIEQMSKEMSSWNANNTISLENGGHGRTKANSKKKPLTKKRRGGVARQPRGLCPNESDTDQQPELNEEEEDREEELPVDSEEENDYESGEEDPMSYFGNATGNTLDSMFANSTPFASISMKPLSSELEAKVQVIDAGTNTDPMEFRPCAHDHSSDSLLSPSTLVVSSSLPVKNEHEKQTSDTRSGSFVVQNRNVPHFNNQEASCANSATTTINAVNDTNNISIDNMSQSDEPPLAVNVSMPHSKEAGSGMPAENSIQEQISRALIKERQEIAERAQSILSPEQIEVLLPKKDDSITNSTTRSVNNDTNNIRPASPQHVEAPQRQLIPKSDVDKMIESAIAEKTVDMVHKSEMEQLIATSVMEEKSRLEKEVVANMIPRTEVDALVQKAREKANAEAVQVQKNMVPKDEVDNLIQEARKDSIVEAQKDMVTKTEADSMALAAVALATEKLIKKKTQEKDALVSDMISKEDAEEMVQQASLAEKNKVNSAIAIALETQKSEFESIKKTEIEQMEAMNAANLEELQAEMDTIKKSELDKLILELEARKNAELEGQKREIEATKTVELEKQRLEFQAAMQVKLDEQKQEIESRIADIEKQKEETSIAKQAEIDALTKNIEAYKKESEETVQRMKTMLTKDSANVLVKRAVADALEAADKKHAEALAGMISREFALRMVQDEVAKALEAERKETSEREEAEAIQMISKAEAEALAKVAAADAIVKERQTMAAREKELITKEEADSLAEAAAREAVDKERAESASVLAKERKALREKEERMINKEEAEQNTKEAVRIALLEYDKSKLTTMNNDSPASARFVSQDQLEAPKSIERSVSTSRLNTPSVNVSPAPSVSTPTNTGRKLKLSSSVSSLRLGSSRKENNIQKSQRPSTDSTSNTFGSFRILENTKYGSHRLQSKSSISLRDLSNKQNSSTSISTISSIDDIQNTHGRMPMPMRSDESFTGFSANGGTDIQVISAITQTMIGEWMSKHTRRYVGGGISENKHQRFFWVHPYTGTLYWSSVEPGFEGNGAKAKSAFIESVSAVPSHDTTGASPMSLLIRTPKRDLKITAPSLERHELWLKSLSFLLHRPNDSSNQIIEEPRLTSDSSVENAGHQQSINSATIDTKASNRSISQMMDVTQYDSDDSDDVVNIRQCCDGKHDVSTLSRGQHHHHH